MKNDELIHMWQKGSERLFSDRKTDKNMITQYLSEKTLKGNRSIHFNLVFYGLIKVANLILLSLNLEGYSNNGTMVWVLLAQLVFTIGALVYGVHVFYRFKEINDYSDSLASLIQKQLRFFRRPYEFWLLLASVSAFILMINLNLYIDNDQGTYVIHNKVLFAGISLMLFVFIYGSLKAVSLLGLRRLKSYLEDLQQGVLARSEGIERARKRQRWLWVVVFLLLTGFLVFGILKALH
jgi:hypothetical protein